MTGRLRPDELDELKRPTYLVGLAVGMPVVALVAVSEWAQSPVVRVAYPVLVLVMVVTGVGLARRTMTVEMAERLVLSVVPVLWLGRLVDALYLEADLALAREVVTVSVGPGLSILVVLIYLATDVRIAVRLSGSLSAAFAVLVAPPVIAAIGDPADVADALAMVRMVVYTTVIALLLYVLATLKEQVAWQRQRADDLDRLAGTDPVTGITNRRRASALLESELEEGERYGRPLSVALIDLDGFKAINDGQGHAAGDRALRDVVDALLVQLRRTDVLARWGGDELLVIAPETTVEELGRSADRWRSRVADLGIASGAAHLTISVGVTERREGDTLDGIVARADMAMYVAKDGGRDRTVAG